MGAGPGGPTKLVLRSAGTGRACGENGSQVLTTWSLHRRPPQPWATPRLGWLGTVPPDT